jgi:MFS family permease
MGSVADGLQRRVLVVLCATQIMSWGTLYYAFPVLAPSLSADTGWSVPTATAAFSAGLVVSALVGIPIGRLLDRVGPRPVMTAGSVIAVPAVVGIATARSFPLFVAAWLLAGVAMAGTLYPPAFAALTRWWGPRRVVALTGLTLAGGLASTIFGPLTAALLGLLGWRDTYLALALLLAVGTVPGHFWGLRGPWPAPEPAQHPAHADPGRVARSGSFLLLAAALTGGAFAVYAVLVGQVPLLIERGMSTTAAAWILGLGGVGQVLGRLGYGGLARLLGVRTRAVVVLTTCAGTTVVLGLLPGPAAALVAAVMVAGAARGIFTLLQATAVTDRWGSVYYGRLSGLVAAPSTFATALAPWAGAALAVPLGGYPGVFLLLAGVAVVAAALAVGSVPRLVTGVDDPGAERRDDARDPGEVPPQQGHDVQQ